MVMFQCFLFIIAILYKLFFSQKIRTSNLASYSHFFYCLLWKHPLLCVYFVLAALIKIVVKLIGKKNQ